MVSVLLVGGLTRLRFDTSFESFLTPDHPTRVALDEFRDRFGRGEPIVVAVRVPGRIVEPAFLNRLRALHDDLEARVLHLDHITSLVNVRATRTTGDDLEIGELLADWPETGAELDELEAFIRSSRLYENYIVGRSEANPARQDPGEWTAIILETRAFASSSMDAGALAEIEGFDGGFEGSASEGRGRRLDSEDDFASLETVRAVLAEHRTDGFEIQLAGSMVIGEVVSSSIKTDFGRLFVFACGAISILLYLLFRRLVVCALVLSVVLLSLAGCLGLMAMIDEPVGFGTQILPSFLLAAGVGYAVHVVTFYFHALRLEQANQAIGTKSTRATRERAIERALDHAGMPILLTALTTIAGLVSFIPVELAPMSQLGVVAPIGIALSTGYSLILLPALLVVLPIECPPARGESGWAESLVVRTGLWGARHPGTVMIGLGVVLVFAGIGIGRLETRHDPLGWLPADSPIRQATDLVDGELGGASVLELLIESKEPGGFQRSDLLTRLADLEHEIMNLETKLIVVGKIAGIHDVVREINQSLHGDHPDAYVVPSDDRLIAQELILFENSGMDDVGRLVDSTYSTARVSVRVDQHDAFHSIPFSMRVESLARARLGDLATVRVTGMYDLKNSVFVSVIEGLKSSYLLALLLIGVMLVAMIGDVRIGLVSLIPNITPILLAMGMMGWLGIPLGVYTLLVGSIALGLAVDDTIHLGHGFVRFEREGNSPLEAIRRSLSTAGVAVLFTSAALICGFIVFGFATLSALLHFGCVTAFAIAAALVADLVVSPALFVWAARNRPSRAKRLRPAHVEAPEHAHAWPRDGESAPSGVASRAR